MKKQGVRIIRRVKDKTHCPYCGAAIYKGYARTWQNARLKCHHLDKVINEKGFFFFHFRQLKFMEKWPDQQILG